MVNITIEDVEKPGTRGTMFGLNTSRGRGGRGGGASPYAGVGGDTSFGDNTKPADEPLTPGDGSEINKGPSFGGRGGRGGRGGEASPFVGVGDCGPPSAGTGANNAPLGGGRGGFGGRGGRGGRGGGPSSGVGDEIPDTGEKADPTGGGFGGSSGFGGRGGRGGRGRGTSGVSDEKSDTAEKVDGATGEGFGGRSGFGGRGGRGGRGGSSSFGGKVGDGIPDTGEKVDGATGGGFGGSSGFGGRGGRGGRGGSSFGGQGTDCDAFRERTGEKVDGATGGGFGGRGGGFGGRGGGFGGRGGGSMGEGNNASRFGAGGNGFGENSRPYGRDQAGQNSGGDGERRNQGTGDSYLDGPSHVPIDRPIAEIVEEDVKMADNYKTICEEDEECVVTGMPDDSPQQMLDKWEDAHFDPKLMANIERSQYIRPRKIQSLTIPLIMDGHDIKGHAETGSGKSAAFLLPIINKIIQKKASNEYTPKRVCPYALIIEPTRELVYQLYDQARKLAEGTDVTVSKAYGKFQRKANAREISEQGCDIIIGTPGRLIDFFSSHYLEFDNLKMLVMDEADQLLEDDNAKELRRLVKMPGWPNNDDRQTLLFSATFPQEVQVWANDWLKKENAMVSNRKLVDANSRVVQKFLKVTREDKNTVLMKMLKKEVDEAKEENPANPPIKRTLVFVRSKRSADVLSTFLNLHELNSTTINGDRTQKQREESLDGFRKGKFTIVVSTDVCARGIDIKDLDHVVNLDLPPHPDKTTYVHRIGRTGRLKEGTATSFFDPAEDMDLAPLLVQTVKTVGQEPPEWLVQASEGKLPDDEPTSNAGGGGGWGSSGGGFGEKPQAAGWGDAPTVDQNGQADNKPAEDGEGKENAEPAVAGFGQPSGPSAAAVENDDW